MEQGSTGDFYVLPEGIISTILSLTSPLDVCRSSVVSSIFRSAADSDAVWEKFLPLDLQEIISRSVSPCPVIFSSKKDLYFRLCHRPILIDEGKKSFALEKGSGKKCFMVAARELSIVWGDIPTYWRWRSLPESRFSEVAELLLVSWLEIHGKIDAQILSPKTIYAAYFVFKIAAASYGLQLPIEVSVVFDGGRDGGKSTVYLDPDGNLRRNCQVSEERMKDILANVRQRVSRQGWTRRGKQLPRERGDGWLEIELGEFFNEEGGEEVEFSLMELKGGKPKSGLIVQGIELRPEVKNKYNEA